MISIIIYSIISGYRPRVRSFSVSGKNSTSIMVSWQSPLETHDCYTISRYHLQCWDMRQKRVVNRTIKHSEAMYNITIIGLTSDHSYNCSILVYVADISDSLTSLNLPPDFSNGYTLPLPPEQPSPPVDSITVTGSPNTITLNIEAFKRSLNSQTSSNVRIAVLRLGSSPTIPQGTPDQLYPSDESFTTYKSVHSVNTGSYLPYFAAEFPVNNVPNSFVVGIGNDTKKRQVSIRNGPLESSDYYTVFVRVYAKSNFGSQYSVFKSTSFLTPPVRPASEQPSSTADPSSSSSGGVIAAVIIVILLIFVVAVIAAIVVIVLFRYVCVCVCCVT